MAIELYNYRPMSTYALENYTFTSSLCWGNCFGHLQKVCEDGPWSDRVVHLTIGLAELLPIISQIISLFEQLVVEWCCIRAQVTTTTPPPPTPTLFPPGCPENLQRIINGAPAFNHYRITLANGQQSTLLAQSVRPANLFFTAIGVGTTLPGSRQLFAIPHDHTAIRRYLASRVGEKVDITAGELHNVYGNRHYRISFQEIVNTLDTQEIYLSPILPLDFYRGLKQAMLQDGLVEVPNMKLRDYTAGFTGAFILQNLRNNPRILDYTFYELGTQVVKREDYHLFIDANGKILEREADANDALRLINMCGIRPTDNSAANPIKSHALMYGAYKSALAAATDGIVIFPAVGLGVWGGDPTLYWTAFFDALISSDEMTTLDHVCVNPGPAASTQTFLRLLAEFKRDNSVHPVRLARLNMIIYLPRQDVLQLGRDLKLAFPDKTISVVNASDPDVTLGNHVGEYVNNIGHPPTTEENFTAAGDNGLHFETLTGVHKNPSRIHALRWV